MTATRVALEGWRRVLPQEPYPQPMRGHWGVLPDAPLPDLLVAEHADPLLVAMLCADLLRRGRLLDTRVLVLTSERDDALRQLLAPLPLPLTVIGATTLLRGQPLTSEAAKHQRVVVWMDVTQPARLLPRWEVVPLIPALARARSVAEAAIWCGRARSTSYAILSTTALHLRLPRRWRSPRQWSYDLVAALSTSPPCLARAALADVGAGWR